MMKLYSSITIAYYLLPIAIAQYISERPPADKNPPPYCKKVAEIIGETESTKVPIGTPLPDHWAEYFGYQNCSIGTVMGCGWGHFTGLGWYYTGSAENWGLASDIKPDHVTQYSTLFVSVVTTKGWFLSKVCSMLNGDADPDEEFLVFDSFQADTGPNIPVGYDLTRATSTTLYTLNPSESEGCEGYHIHFGFNFYGYGGTPEKPYGGCEYDKCTFKGEICKWVDEDEYYADGPEIIIIDERNPGKKSKSSKKAKKTKSSTDSYV